MDGCTHRVPAAQLRIGDLVVDGLIVRTVASIRVQGTPAEAVVELVGLPQRRHYPVHATIEIADAA